MNKLNNQNINTIISLLILIIVIVIGVFLLKDTRPTENNVKEKNKVNTLNINVGEITENDHILGNKDAIIKIVEFSDLECIFCKRFHSTMHQIVDESQGFIAWVYRHFPISGENSPSYKQALASECAFEQGGNEMFWAFIDGIFERTESKNTFDENQLNKLAIDLKLDINQFNECLQSEKYKGKIQSHIKDGISAGVSGTPTSFIFIGEEAVDEISGALPYESLMQKIANLFQ